MQPTPCLALIDDGRGRFGPLCDLASAAELRTGAWSTREWLERLLGPIAAIRVPSSIAGVTAESVAPASLPSHAEDVIVVNARCADRSMGSSILALAPNEGLVSGEDLVAARLSHRDADALMARGARPPGLAVREAPVALLSRPWDILHRLQAAITQDIEALAGDPAYLPLADPHPSRMGHHSVLVHPAATVGPYVVFDASAGPILVGPHCTLRPFSVLCGPCALGAHTIVSDRSLLKPGMSCGPHCRLGGEIGGTSIAGYSNKTHDGHLGDSVLGSWVNLGAGTDNSNLLNTYGEVPIRLEPEGQRERTGRIFLGAVIGDHVKCAIGTRLMTGTVLGTGSMIASSTPPPSTTPRFTWRTDDGERRYALPKFLEVMRTVMKRRAVEPGAEYVARVSGLWGEDQG